ncbi:MAG: zinc-dependent alcohol dehydrogenase family protein [Anaerolineales bacterium]|nr:zinc-dependent alcohol dehydrogenase family protein [Anaerolineales bacterium]
MRAMQFVKQKPTVENSLLLTELPVPEPGAAQVRLRVQVCGVCHTDLHIVEGEIFPTKMPIIPGHQVVGVVDALGEGVTGLKKGQRVGVPWFYDACGSCNFCRTGNENLCSKARFTGFNVDGGFAEYMLAESRYVLLIPDELSDEQAAPLLCAGIIGYRSLRKADVLPGERIGLFGFGASAHLAIQVARYWDCEVYTFTRSQKHRDHAFELGSAWVGGASDQPPKLLDRAIIFAPVGKIVHDALGKLRPGGTLAINAIHMSPIPEMPYELIYGERTMRSVANATYEDGVAFLDLAVKIPIKATVEIYGLEDANQALDAVKNSRINGEAVLMVR